MNTRSDAEKPSGRRTVGIVGAGIAGLTCGRHLAESGWQVTVVEKSRGPGGRMSTRRTDGGAFDHGAQYFTARDARFRAELERWRASGVADVWTGRFAVYRGGEPFALDDGQQRFVGVPRMSAITRHLAADLEVHTEWRVGRVERENDGWWFRHPEEDSLGPFDRAVIAVPAPQAAPLLSPSPTLAVQTEEVRMSSCWAVMAAFPARLNAPFDAAFTESPRLPWLARNNSKPGRDEPEAWVLHASNVWSDGHIDADPQQVIDQLLSEFADLVGGVPEPVTVRAQRWRYALPAQVLGTEYLWDEDLGIGACGDWCGGPRVEGAFLSGLQLAERIADSKAS